MSLLAAVAALGFGASALLGTLAQNPARASLAAVARVLAALSAAALLPAASAGSDRPIAALALGVAVLPRPLALLAGASGALLVALRPAAPAPLALILLGLAAAPAVAALSSSATARLASGLDAAWAAVAGGAMLGALLLRAGGGRVLHWSYVLGAGDARVELRSAGLLFSLALVACVGGVALLASHCLTNPPGAEGLTRRLGQRALLIGAGFAVLGLGFVVALGFDAHALALTASAPELAGLLTATGLLVLGLVLLLGGAPVGGTEELEAQAAGETRLAALLVVLAAVAAGLEGWLEQGTYATPTAVGALAAALLALAALQPTRLGTLRRAALAAGLISLLV